MSYNPYPPNAPIFPSSPYPPNTNTIGWKCPTCKNVYAPWVYTCLTCSNKSNPPTTTYPKTTVSPTPPPPGDVTYTYTNGAQDIPPQGIYSSVAVDPEEQAKIIAARAALRNPKPEILGHNREENS